MLLNGGQLNTYAKIQIYISHLLKMCLMFSFCANQTSYNFMLPFNFQFSLG